MRSRLTTRREYLILAKSLYTYAVQNQYIQVNPAISGIIPPKKKKARNQREAFTMEDLTRIFSPGTFLKWSEGHPERFYINDAANDFKLFALNVVCYLGHQRHLLLPLFCAFCDRLLSYICSDIGWLATFNILQ